MRSGYRVVDTRTGVPAALIAAALAALSLSLLDWVLQWAQPGFDLAIYRRAASELREGSPYLTNLNRSVAFHYWYPPLLATLMPFFGHLAWFGGLLGGSVAYITWESWRDRGWGGVWVVLSSATAWIMTWISGHVDLILLALLVFAVKRPRFSGLALALATSVKPIYVIPQLWLARREGWRALISYAAWLVLLGLLQAPWLDSYIRYASTIDMDRLPTFWSLWRWGIHVTMAMLALLTWVAFRYPREQLGWVALLMLLGLITPRVYISTAALLMAAAIKPETQKSPAPSAGAMRGLLRSGPQTHPQM